VLEHAIQAVVALSIMVGAGAMVGFTVKAFIDSRRATARPTPRRDKKMSKSLETVKTNLQEALALVDGILERAAAKAAEASAKSAAPAKPAKPAAPAKAAKPAKKAGPTLEEVREQLLQVIEQRSNDQARAILAEHEAKRLSELDEASYASVIKACQDLLKAEDAGEPEGDEDLTA